MTESKKFVYKVIGEEIYYTVIAKTVHQADRILLETHKELSREGLRIVKNGKLILLSDVKLA